MGFKNIIVQQSAGGQPTFVYNENVRRSSGVSFPKLAISDSELRADAIRVNPTLTDNEQRTDVYRIPTAQFAMTEQERRADSPQIPLLRISDQAQRTDKTTVSVLFQTPGTRNFIVPNGVSSMVMEAWGSGGPGGTATVNGGGGGKGGGYARRNAQAVTAGQSLTVSVSAATATGNGAASSVSTGGGNQASIGAQTFTYNAAVGGGTITSSPIGQTVKISGTLSFVGASTASANTGFTLPANVQAGDYIVAISRSANSTSSLTNDGFTILASVPEQGNFAGNATVLFKIATAADANATYTENNGSTANYPAAAVYRGVTAISYIGSSVAATNTASVSCPGVSGVTGDWALFFTSSYKASGGAMNAVTPPAGVNERVENFVQGSATVTAGGKNSINDAPLAAVAGTTLVSAAGGNAGGAGSATAGGTGATAQNGTSVGDVTFTGGNGTNGSLTAGGTGGGGAGSNGNATGATGAGQLGGNGGASTAAGSVYGGAGGGATTLAGAGPGAQGAVRLTFTI